MNQILVSEKLYVTPELKRKKRMYKFDFFISIFLVVILFSYYIYAEYDKGKNESISQEILSNISFEDNVVDDTTIKFTNNAIVVILNTEDPSEVSYIEPEPTEENTAETNSTIDENSVNWLSTSRGTRYYALATVTIPSIDCTYPVLNETSEELLKIAPCKFWGCDPNEVGNFCIVGHNYRSNKFFSHVPELSIGDIIKVTDLSNRTIDFAVYDKYVVDPADTTCTTQRTNGQKEVTIITCTNDSKQRVIIKAREA